MFTFLPILKTHYNKREQLPIENEAKTINQTQNLISFTRRKFFRGSLITHNLYVACGSLFEIYVRYSKSTLSYSFFTHHSINITYKNQKVHKQRKFWNQIVLEKIHMIKFQLFSL